MVDDIISVFTLALIVTALSVVVMNGTKSAQVINSVFTGFAGVQRAASGK